MGARNSNLGKAPIFRKTFFDLWGKSLPKNAAHSLMHSHLSPLSRFWSYCAFPSHDFVDFLIFPMAGKSFWKAQWLGSLLDGFGVVYPHYQLGQTVFMLQSEWEKRPMIYGVFVESVFPT